MRSERASPSYRRIGGVVGIGGVARGVNFLMNMLDKEFACGRFGHLDNLATKLMICFAEIFIPIARDIIVSLAAIIAAGAAFATARAAVDGVNSWKHELMGRKSLKVAENLFGSTRKVKNAIEACRDTWLDGSEYPEGCVLSASDRKQNADALEHVYKNRRNLVEAARQEFDAAMLRAEFLWGSDVVAKAEEIRSCTRALRMAIGLYIKDERSGGEVFKKDEKRRAEVLAIVGHYGMQAASFDYEVGDLFAKRVENAVVEIEKHIRSYMPTRNDRHNRT